MCIDGDKHPSIDQRHAWSMVQEVAHAHVSLWQRTNRTLVAVGSGTRPARGERVHHHRACDHDRARV